MVHTIVVRVRIVHKMITIDVIVVVVVVERFDPLRVTVERFGPLDW